RDPFYFTAQITIQHHIPDDEDIELIKFVEDGLWIHSKVINNIKNKGSIDFIKKRLMEIKFVNGLILRGAKPRRFLLLIA
ncbi:MAG: hypothetical protein ACI8P3_002186, partial [Saprospiraceae bacterium]